MKRPSLAVLRRNFARNVVTISAWKVSDYKRRPPIPPDQRKSVKISKEVDIVEVERVLYPFGYLGDTDDEEDDIYVEEDDDNQACVKQSVEEIMKSMGLPTSFISKSAATEDEKENFEQTEPAPKKAKKSKRPVVTNISSFHDARDIDKTIGLRPSSPELGSSVPEMSEEAIVQKYWPQRYSLFSLFDSGIQMDATGWYSVTPERIAKHIAERCGASKSLLIYDPFGGVGGNAIQFALAGHHVICGDVSGERLAMAKHNATIYDVEDYIDFIQGDFFEVVKRVMADVIFLSPPWGGPSYAHAESFQADWMMSIDGKAVFDAALQAAPNIIYYLPRNSSLESIARLVDGASEDLQRFEVEENWSGTKDGRNLGGLKAISVYFGPLFRRH